MFDGPRRALVVLLTLTIAVIGEGAEPNRVRVAAISLVPRKFDLQGNAERLERALREAARGGAKIAVAPEGVLEGYVVNEIIAGEEPAQRMNEVAVSIDSPVMRRFQQLARELRMCLVFGLAEKIGDDVYNCAVFVDDQGQVSGKYHKMQLAEGYHRSWWFNRLGKASRAFDTPYGRCGILICNDRWNPSLARIPALDGAQFLVIPSYGSRSKSQDEAVLNRGRETGLPVIEANVGVTLIVDKGQIVAVDRDEEGITFADITIPDRLGLDAAKRDQVEREFLDWRTTEMAVRYQRTLARHVDANGKKANNDAPKLKVGAYYYPWYRLPGVTARLSSTRLGWMSKALRGRLQPPQLPKLGVYDSRDPQVIADHIAQSVQANISFWAVSWWGPGARDDRTFREHILKHPDAGKLRYAVLYESTGRFGRFHQPVYDKLLPDFEYLAKQYFDHPNYLHINGKPVVFIYLTRAYFRDRGQEALAQLRSTHPDLFLIGDEVFGPHCRAQDVRQWDAITAYDVYGQSLQGDGASRAAVTRLKNNYTHAATVADRVGVAFVPAVSPGFNDRAVRAGHPGRGRYFRHVPDSKEGDVFRAMLREVAIPMTDEKVDRMLMVTSFNEWYEDTQIEATRGSGGGSSRDDSSSGRHYADGDRYQDYGSLYLDILRELTIPVANPGK